MKTLQTKLQRYKANAKALDLQQTTVGTIIALGTAVNLQKFAA